MYIGQEGDPNLGTHDLEADGLEVNPDAKVRATTSEYVSRDPGAVSASQKCSILCLKRKYWHPCLFLILSFLFARLFLSSSVMASLRASLCPVLLFSCRYLTTSASICRRLSWRFSVMLVFLSPDPSNPFILLL